MMIRPQWFDVLVIFEGPGVMRLLLFGVYQVNQSECPLLSNRPSTVAT